MRVETGIAFAQAGLKSGHQIGTADALLMLLVFISGLFLDRAPVELPLQTGGSVLVWAVMLRALHRARGDLRVIILACLAWSSLGEVIGSLIWGLYKYRLYNIPWFVPPGHVLMLLLAMHVARRWGSVIILAAPITAALYAAYSLATGGDLFSVIITPIFFVTLLFARERA